MTPQQIEAMKLALEALKKCHYYMINAGLPNQSLLNEAFTAYKALEGLKEHAMQEVQRLGQEIEQEPVACKTLCELCVKRGYFFCANAVKELLFSRVGNAGCYVIGLFLILCLGAAVVVAVAWVFVQILLWMEE